MGLAGNLSSHLLGGDGAPFAIFVGGGIRDFCCGIRRDRRDLARSSISNVGRAAAGGAEWKKVSWESCNLKDLLGTGGGALQFIPGEAKSER